jgi:hypothetical protein
MSKKDLGDWLQIAIVLFFAIMLACLALVVVVGTIALIF